MGQVSKIAWTDATFNPWIGCTKVSEGCAHCYAEAQDKRWGHDSWGPGKPRRITTPEYWRQPLKWNKQAKESCVRKKVFCASLADIFDEESPALPVDLISEYAFAVAGSVPFPSVRLMLFDLIERTEWLDWLLLTKRPERIPECLPQRWAKTLPRNVWLGTTTENQKRFDERVHHLMKLRVRASVLFLSVEPQLGPIDIAGVLGGGRCSRGCVPSRDDNGCWICAGAGFNMAFAPAIDWVIVGGESGGGARPFEIEWARSLQAQCARNFVPFFMKQLGAKPMDVNIGGPVPYLGRFPIVSRKGDDMEEWPVDLRIQQFPIPRVIG